jgi:hypothetical protein
VGALWRYRYEAAPVAIVMAAGALHRALEDGPAPLGALLAVHGLALLLLLVGAFLVRRDGHSPRFTLWAIMIVTAGMELARTATMALPEDDAIILERQTNTVLGAINVVGYALIIGLAVLAGRKSMRHAFLVAVAHAAVFAPTWPFLSPGADEPAYFVVRWVLLAFALVILGVIAFAFHSYDAMHREAQRRIVIVLLSLAVARVAIAGTPSALTTPLATVDSVFFGVAGFLAGTGLVLGLTWLGVRARASTAVS